MDPNQQQRITDPYTELPRMSHSPPPHPAAGQMPPTVTPSIQQPSFAHEIQLPPTENALYEGCLSFFGKCFGFIGILPCGCCCPNPFKTVNQGEVGLIAKFGKYYRSVDPGLHEINVITETLRTINIKLQIEDIPAQVITTKDNVSVILDSVLYWHIVDPYIASYLVENVRLALVERTQTTLRQITGTKTLQEAIEHRETIGEEIQSIIGKVAKDWGVKVESILIKDLKFSQDLQENLSAAAKQKRIGESKVIAAQAEVDSAKLMREAADILNSPAAMQIRYLETLQNMAKTSGSKLLILPANSSEFSTDDLQRQMILNEATQ